MKRLLVRSVVLLPAGLLLASCAAPSPAGEAGTPGAKVVSPALKAAWEQRWDEILAEARKEASIAVYSSWTQDIRSSLTSAFRDKYGISLEFSTFGRSAEVVTKVQAEQRAGLYLADVFAMGVVSLPTAMKPAGLLGPIRPLLILPEVLDPRAWREAKLPFVDEEGTALRLIDQVNRNLVYNTAMVQEGEITTAKDLLKPQYKGKITSTDPSISGTFNSFLTSLGYESWGEAETAEFLRRLIRDQQLVIVRDVRLNIESVSRGKFAIGLSPQPALVSEFMAVGAPIKIAPLQEEVRVTGASGGLGAPTRFSHPNGAIVFVNWLLTREGQSLFARRFGSPSTRLDASTEGVNPAYVPDPGKKYISFETPEFLVSQVKWQQLARRIMDESMK